MDRALRVAHVVLSLDCGGLERVVLDLVAEGRRLGQGPAVICLERPGTLAPAARATGAAVVCADKQPGTRPTTIRRVQSILRRLRPDVVHTHQIGALFYAGPAAHFAHVPLVVHTEHGKNYASRLRTRVLGRMAARFARRFFCVSDDIAAEVIACRITRPDRVQVVRNGIDVDHFAPRVDKRRLRQTLGLPVDGTIIGTIGRLSEIKRQDLLIDAFARLAAQCADLHLLLVGDGPMMSSLRAQAGRLGVERRVHFAGYQAQAERYLWAMDVFALTSRSEGMPLAVLEAWAAGLPVVASRVGGLPELIDDGRNGLLFEAGDRAAAEAALRRMICDAPLAGRLGRAGQEHVRARHHRRTMAAEYIARYRALLPTVAVASRTAELHRDTAMSLCDAVAHRATAPEVE